jgi:hypothetical protein
MCDCNKRSIRNTVPIFTIANGVIFLMVKIYVSILSIIPQVESNISRPKLLLYLLLSCECIVVYY